MNCMLKVMHLNAVLLTEGLRRELVHRQEVVFTEQIQGWFPLIFT